jgi:Domain of unknown function (DUF4276)
MAAWRNRGDALVKVKIYVEGGGDSRGQQVPCRKAFATLLERARPGKAKPSIVACGGRAQTYKDFCSALKHPEPDTFYILLVDSEDPLTTADFWEHVHLRPGDGWPRPTAATDEQIQLMVTCTETWIVADRATLR